MAEDVFLEDALNQRAVYWAPGVINNEGQKDYGEPIEIACRWENIAEQFLDPDNNTQSSRAKVMVDQDLEMLGVLWLPPNSSNLSEGEAIAQLTDETTPFANAGAYEIRRFDRIPNWDADEFIRLAYL